MAVKTEISVEMATALSNSHYSGHHEATEKEGDQAIPGEEIWSQKSGQQDSSWRKMEAAAQDITGRRKTVRAPLGATRHNFISRVTIRSERE